MRRRYTVGEFRRAVDMIRGRVADVSVTTDVIVGFPGETDADFEATIQLCEETSFAGTHCFRYSRRPHTGAEMMSGHLPPHIRRERLDRLLAVAKRSALEFRQTFAGRIMDVLWERESDGMWQGLTGNYIRAYTSADSDLENRLTSVRIAESLEDGVTAAILDTVRIQ
jgi:threonylcarbamoyladenosine tRNA methylthiotransferase MtaB